MRACMRVQCFNFDYHFKRQENPATLPIYGLRCGGIPDWDFKSMQENGLKKAQELIFKHNLST